MRFFLSLDREFKNYNLPSKKKTRRAQLKWAVYVGKISKMPIWCLTVKRWKKNYSNILKVNNTQENAW